MDNSDKNLAKVAAAPVDSAKSSAAFADKVDRVATAADQRHLREFNEWLARWISYQGLLAQYWKKRAQYEQELTKRLAADGGTRLMGKWGARFQELCEYKNEYGNCHVPNGFIYKHKPSLGNWVKNMRRLKKIDKLEPEKVMRLTQIGFEFVPVARETAKFTAQWHASFMQLKAYKDRHGNIEVPAGYTMPNGKKLDQWILRQRRLFKEGKLPAELINKLENLDMNLKGRGRPFGLDSPEWFDRYKELLDYFTKHGDCDVPETYENNALSLWVKRQRDLYKMEALSNDRFKKLTDLGFNMLGGKKKVSPPPLNPWSTRILELQAFKEANGHTDVPRTYGLNLALGIWAKDQRLAKAEGRLTEEQIKSLEEIGFNFATKSQRAKPLKVWDRNFQALVEYKENNDGSFKGLVAQNPRISDWLKRQRRQYREKKLRQDRIDRLKELGVTFKEPVGRIRSPAVKVSWETQYETLVEYKHKHGDINASPIIYPQYRSLCQWINTQRFNYKNDKLSSERVKLLEAVGFDFSSGPIRTQDNKPSKGEGFLSPSEFDHHLQKLAQYKEQNGNTNVPQRYEQDRLGAFVHYMRLYHKTGKLSETQNASLTELGFDFDVKESAWNTRYEELKAYKEENGHFFVPYSENSPLHQWKNNQIRRYNENKLPQEHVDKLLKIGFDFTKRTPKKTKSELASTPPLRVHQFPENREQYLQELWDANYNKLASIYEQRGNCDIPLKYPEDPSLGSWCFAQKLARKKNKLSDDKVEKLEMLGFKF